MDQELTHTEAMEIIEEWCRDTEKTSCLKRKQDDSSPRERKVFSVSLKLHFTMYI